MIYKASCLRSVSYNPVSGLEHQNSHSKSYQPDMEIPSIDSESPLKMTPDGIQIITFREGHLTISLAPQIILVIMRDTKQLSKFCVQVQNLLQKWVQTKVEPHQLEVVTQPPPHAPTLFQVQQVLQAESALGTMIFRIPLKNQSWNRSNHPNLFLAQLAQALQVAFYGLVRHPTMLGTPDLESPQRDASDDI